MNFMETLANTTFTENSAFALKSTGDKNVDFFGAVDRYMKKGETVEKFEEALRENPEIAFLNLIFLRDIEKGKGVRENFRVTANYFLIKYPYMLEPLFNILVQTKIGRADDLHFILSGEVLANQYAELLKSNLANGMVAKWLPTKGSSTNKIRTARANKLAKLWGLTPKQYRKLVVGLRKKLDLPETRVCEENFENVVYSAIPSLAMARYSKIFAQKDHDNYVAFLDSVKKGETKLNVGTLSPVDLVAKYFVNRNWKGKVDDNLTNYINTAWTQFERPTNPKKTLVVADVSGSMECCNCRPMATSVAAALYTSEILPEPYKNRFITFSSFPEVVEIKGQTVIDKLYNISEAEWGMSTNLSAVFELILRTGKRSKEMVDRVLIISDMQINECVRADQTIIEQYRERFADNGFKLPQVIFWNVNAKNFQITAHESGVALISGESTGIFELALTAEIPTPYELMIDTLVSIYSSNQFVMSALDVFSKTEKSKTL